MDKSVVDGRLPTLRRSANREAKQRYYDWHGPDLAIGEIRRAVAASDMVLDIGCGTGWVLSELWKDGIHGVGIDLDTHALSLTAHDVPVIAASVMRLPFMPKSFDAVVAKDILEHLQSPGKALSEVSKVLRPAGVLYVSVPHAGSSTFWDDYTHVRPFTAKSIKALLEDNGFLVTSICFSGSWPGLGIVSRFSGRNDIPQLVKILARLKVRRQNIHVVARKRA